MSKEQIIPQIIGSIIGFIILIMLFSRGCSCIEQDVRLKTLNNECVAEIHTLVWDRLILGQIIYSKYNRNVSCDKKLLEEQKEKDYKEAEERRKLWKEVN